MWFISERKRYVRAMLKAIDEARESVWIGVKPSSKTDGLRAIRRFERVNEIKFDPFDSLHVEMVSSRGEDERFFRKTSQIFKRLNNEW